MLSSVVLKICYGKLVVCYREIIISGEGRIDTDIFPVKFKTLLMLSNRYKILMPLRTPIIKNSPEFPLV